MEKFADKIVRRLDRMGKRQSHLVRETNLTQSTISDIMNGKRRPALDQAFAIARALDVPLDYLADDEMEEPPASPGGLPQDQKTVLDLYLALKLTLDEALRRLAGPGAAMKETSAATTGHLKSG